MPSVKLNINIKYLRSFLAMAEERSSARAALRLGIPRQSVTQHVAAIEKSVGRKLLETCWPREPRQVGRTQLTEAGLAFFPKAVRAVRAHDELFDDRPCGKTPSETRLETLRSLLELALDTTRNNSIDENYKISGDFMIAADLIHPPGPAENPRQDGSPAESQGAARPG